ncbi:polar amino acid transport system substrate-binding protein [Pseudomonas fluvialis]|uniref:Polar amino acid transport system substrate-binding protein n=1 Tax=Pseudomonas fluvialis TaxID=1793966 RepID=A0A7X0BPR4_9PSED|nr:transporter substrate-binding domain-containing protein [Pseudomonas fluvialis]MBB6340587.1 polar amino acid transport system substrate-binding protein [Pseudomonas fluvialis]
MDIPRYLLAALLSVLIGQAHAERILIAAEDDWPPYSARQADSPEPAGFTPALVREIFARRDIAVEFITVPFSRCLHYAQTGYAVACFNVTITDANRDQYYWHPTPMFHEGLAIFARRGRFQPELSGKDLQGHRVGITNAYTYPSDFMQNPKIERAVARSDANLLNMLIKGRVDFIIMNSLPGQLRILEEKLGPQIERVGMISLDGFWLSFSRNHPDGERLSKIFEEELVRLMASGRVAELELEMKTRLGLRLPQDAQAGQ